MTISAAYKGREWIMPLFYKGERVTSIDQQYKGYIVTTESATYRNVSGGAKTGKA